MLTLYSTPKCPYSLRAKLALCSAKITFTLIECDLMNKPESLLKHSSDSSVPVLVFDDGKTIQESKDIAEWADPDFPNKEPQLFNGTSREVEPKSEYEQVMQRFPIEKPIVINPHVPSIKERMIEKLNTLNPSELTLTNVSQSHAFCHGIEGHFTLKIKASELEKLSPVEKQRHLNSLLKDEIKEIHSLSYA